MQNPKIKNRKHAVLTLFVILLLAFVTIIPNVSFGAEKKTKKQPIQKEIVITDSNVLASFKKAEEALRKGDAEGSIRIFVKTYDYTKEALATIGFIQNQYEKLIDEPAISQSEKEEIFIKLKRIKQLVPKYTNIKAASAYNIGYIYAKWGDSEKARKYLSEVLETTRFSTRQDSIWMKSKTLLLEQYGLEGEF